MIVAVNPLWNIVLPDTVPPLNGRYSPLIPVEPVKTIVTAPVDESADNPLPTVILVTPDDGVVPLTGFQVAFPDASEVKT